MAERGGEVNDVVTAMAQAWVGGIVAWQRTMNRVWAGFQEGAHIEEPQRVPGGDDNADPAFANGPSGPLVIKFLAHASREDLIENEKYEKVDDVPAADRKYVIGPEHLQLSRMQLLPGYNRIYVTVLEVPEGTEPGDYTGRVDDAVDGRTVAIVNPTVSADAPVG